MSDATIIDGKAFAAGLREKVAAAVTSLKDRHGLESRLDVVLVGDDPASAVYVRNKGRACREVGIFNETFHLEAATTQTEIVALVQQLNTDQRFHGILVQDLAESLQSPSAASPCIRPIGRRAPRARPPGAGERAGDDPQFRRISPSFDPPHGGEWWKGATLLKSRTPLRQRFALPPSLPGEDGGFKNCRAG